jgi:glycosyltransferase involved in cell wall biosynthesis
MFFSIIIPAYNRSTLILDTLNSVTQQSYTDWECIVIDDGSKDNTREFVQKVIEKDNRFKYVYQENAERSAARNNGVKHAIGRYICFLDSDDQFKEHHLQGLFDVISKRNFKDEIYYTDCTIVKPSERIEITDPLGADLIHFLVHHPIIPARICSSAEIFKKNLYDEDIVVVEDLILWLRLAVNYPFYHVNQNTVLYYLHDDNSVDIKNTGFQKRLAGLLKFQKRYLTIWKMISKKDQLFLIGNTHFGIARHYIHHHQQLKAIKHLVYSIYYQRKHTQLKHKLFLTLQLLKGKYEY